jgi:hypothetical protein
MKRIIRLTESDLARIVRRVIKENEYEEYDQDMDDYSELAPSYDSDRKFMGMVKPSGDMEMYEDEEWGETDRGEEDLQDLLEEARDILENELGMSIDAINEMDEWYIVDVLHEHMYDELAYDIEHLMEVEGFYNVDEDEPYDAIGGQSVNDLKKAFAKTKSKDEELGEGWDDFIQKKRYPEDYKRENYRNLPKDVFKSGSKIDGEGTIITKKYEDPFDEYEDFDDEEYA